MDAARSSLEVLTSTAAAAPSPGRDESLLVSLDAATRAMLTVAELVVDKALRLPAEQSAALGYEVAKATAKVAGTSQSLLVHIATDHFIAAAAAALPDAGTGGSPLVAAPLIDSVAGVAKRHCSKYGPTKEPVATVGALLWLCSMLEADPAAVSGDGTVRAAGTWLAACFKAKDAMCRVAAFRLAVGLLLATATADEADASGKDRTSQEADVLKLVAKAICSALQRSGEGGSGAKGADDVAEAAMAEAALRPLMVWRGRRSLRAAAKALSARSVAGRAGTSSSTASAVRASLASLADAAAAFCKSAPGNAAALAPGVAPALGRLLCTLTWASVPADKMLPDSFSSGAAATADAHDLFAAYTAQRLRFAGDRSLPLATKELHTLAAAAAKLGSAAANAALTTGVGQWADSLPGDAARLQVAEAAIEAAEHTAGPAAMPALWLATIERCITKIAPTPVGVAATALALALSETAPEREASLLLETLWVRAAPATRTAMLAKLLDGGPATVRRFAAVALIARGPGEAARKGGAGNPHALATAATLPTAALADGLAVVLPRAAPGDRPLVMAGIAAAVGGAVSLEGLGFEGAFLRALHGAVAEAADAQSSSELQDPRAIAAVSYATGAVADSDLAADDGAFAALIDTVSAAHDRAVAGISAVLSNAGSGTKSGKGKGDVATLVGGDSMRGSLVAIAAFAMMPGCGKVAADSPALNAALGSLKLALACGEGASAVVGPTAPFVTLLPSSVAWPGESWSHTSALSARPSTTDLAIDAVACCFGAGEFTARKHVFVALFDMLGVLDSASSVRRGAVSRVGLHVAVCQCIYRCLRCAARLARPVKRPELAATLLEQLQALFLVSEAPPVRMLAAVIAAELPIATKAGDVEVANAVLRPGGSVPDDSKTAFAAAFAGKAWPKKSAQAEELASARLEAAWCLRQVGTSPVGSMVSATALVHARGERGSLLPRVLPLRDAVNNVPPEALVASTTALALVAQLPAAGAATASSPADAAIRSLVMRCAAHACVQPGQPLVAGVTADIAALIGAYFGSVAASAGTTDRNLSPAAARYACTSLVSPHASGITSADLPPYDAHMGRSPLSTKAVCALLSGRPQRLSDGGDDDDASDDDDAGPGGKGHTADDTAGDGAAAAAGLSSAVARVSGKAKAQGATTTEPHVAAAVLHFIARSPVRDSAVVAPSAPDCVALVKAVASSVGTLGDDTGLGTATCKAVATLLTMYGAAHDPAQPNVPLLDELRIHLAATVRTIAGDANVAVAEAAALVAVFASAVVADDAGIARCVRAVCDRFAQPSRVWAQLPSAASRLQDTAASVVVMMVKIAAARPAATGLTKTQAALESGAANPAIAAAVPQGVAAVLVSGPTAAQIHAMSALLQGGTLATIPAGRPARCIALHALMATLSSGQQQTSAAAEAPPTTQQLASIAGDQKVALQVLRTLASAIARSAPNAVVDAGLRVAAAVLSTAAKSGADEAAKQAAYRVVVDCARAHASSTGWVAFITDLAAAVDPATPRPADIVAAVTVAVQRVVPADASGSFYASVSRILASTAPAATLVAAAARRNAANEGVAAATFAIASLHPEGDGAPSATHRAAANALGVALTTNAGLAPGVSEWAQSHAPTALGARVAVVALTSVAAAAGGAGPVGPLAMRAAAKLALGHPTDAAAIDTALSAIAAVAAQCAPCRGTAATVFQGLASHMASEVRAALGRLPPDVVAELRAVASGSAGSAPRAAQTAPAPAPAPSGAAERGAASDAAPTLSLNLSAFR